MARVVVCECCVKENQEFGALLQGEDYDLISCEDGEHLLEAVAERRPDAVVYTLKGDFKGDLGVLHLLRRMAPAVPLILLARDGSLRAQRMLQELRPIYYAVLPVEAAELRDAVRAALAHRARSSA